MSTASDSNGSSGSAVAREPTLSVRQSVSSSSSFTARYAEKVITNGTHLLEKNKVKVLCVTWNMQGKCPSNSQELKSFIKMNCYHIYCFGTQECERSIKGSLISQSKSEWVKRLTEVVGDEYVSVASNTLLAMHHAVYVRKELVSYVSDIRTESVACGLFDQVGNKGGTAISFMLLSTSFLFINCHLAAHQDNVEQRNSDYTKILLELSKKMAGFSEQRPNNILSTFDNIFWLGDTNYRINGNKVVVEKLIQSNMLEVLLANDQLSQQRKRGEAFAGLTEGDIKFNPTYKYCENSDKYDDSKKQRIPAWTDRILFRSNSDSIQLLEYNCSQTCRISDHRPVFAKFLVACADSLEGDEDAETSSSTESNLGIQKSSVCIVS